MELNMIQRNRSYHGYQKGNNNKNEVKFLIDMNQNYMEIQSQKENWEDQERGVLHI